MKRKLLLRAVEVLSKIPKKQFDLDTWIGGKAEQMIESGEKVKKKDLCGTNACAGGWLGLTPEFQKKGLKFTVEKVEGYWGDSFYTQLRFIDPKTKWQSSGAFDGLAKLFDISDDQSDALFNSAGDGEYDNDIYHKHGEDISDRDLFAYRVKTLINNAKKGKK